MHNLLAESAPCFRILRAEEYRFGRIAAVFGDVAPAQERKEERRFERRFDARDGALARRVEIDRGCERAGQVGAFEPEDAAPARGVGAKLRFIAARELSGGRVGHNPFGEFGRSVCLGPRFGGRVESETRAGRRRGGPGASDDAVRADALGEFANGIGAGRRAVRSRAGAGRPDSDRDRIDGSCAVSQQDCGRFALDAGEEVERGEIVDCQNLKRLAELFAELAESFARFPFNKERFGEYERQNAVRREIPVDGRVENEARELLFAPAVARVSGRKIEQPVGAPERVGPRAVVGREFVPRQPRRIPEYDAVTRVLFRGREGVSYADFRAGRRSQEIGAPLLGRVGGGRGVEIRARRDDRERIEIEAGDSVERFAGRSSAPR